MPKRLISKSTKRTVVSKYKKGETVESISKEIGCAKETVRRIIHNDPTVTMRRRGHRFDGPATASNGASHPGSSPISKRSRYKRKKSGPGLENACKTWTADEDDIIIDAVASGMELKDTASLLGRTKVAVSGRKSYLIKNKIITEDGVRFPRPEGITYVKQEPYEVLPTTDDSPMSSVKLSDIAQVVRDYGVSASISINSQGIKIDVKA